jgi:hypothetical protein
MQIEEVPEDIRAEVTTWLEYFQAPKQSKVMTDEQHS